MRIRLLLALAALACVLAFSPAARPKRALALTNCTTDASVDTEELAFLGLINSYRQQNGLQPLALSYGLTKPSQWKSVDLATNAYFAHDDLSRTWDQRIVDCGYTYNTWLGENIAAGYSTAQAVFGAWRNSPGHNANMLGANYTAIGIGRYSLAGSPYGVYWTTDFGGVSDGYVAVTESPAPLVAPMPDAAPTAHALAVPASTGPTSPTAATHGRSHRTIRKLRAAAHRIFAHLRDEADHRR
jgi:uncharacterized protein YkwD